MSIKLVHECIILKMVRQTHKKLEQKQELKERKNKYTHTYIYIYNKVRQC